MNNIVQTIFGIILACGILIVLWFNYRDRFDVDIPNITTRSGCIEAVNNSETKVISEFERRALESIGGGNVDDKFPLPDKLDEWRPSLQSLTFLFDTNAIVDMALSRLRTNIAQGQQEDPNSLVNRQKIRLSEVFAAGRTWCENLPK